MSDDGNGAREVAFGLNTIGSGFGVWCCCMYATGKTAGSGW